MKNAIISERNAKGIAFILMDEDGKPVRSGQTVTDFRGDESVITGGRPPHKPGTCGFVWIGDKTEVYASVFGLKWLSQT
jgi:hypothetical protein